MQALQRSKHSIVKHTLPREAERTSDENPCGHERDEAGRRRAWPRPWTGWSLLPNGWAASISSFSLDEFRLTVLGPTSF